MPLLVLLLALGLATAAPWAHADVSGAERATVEVVEAEEERAEADGADDRRDGPGAVWPAVGDERMRTGPVAALPERPPEA